MIRRYAQAKVPNCHESPDSTNSFFGSQGVPIPADRLSRFHAPAAVPGGDNHQPLIRVAIRMMGATPVMAENVIFTA